jgi:hypothetical protein
MSSGVLASRSHVPCDTTETGCVKMACLRRGECDAMMHQAECYRIERLKVSELHTSPGRCRMCSSTVLSSVVLFSCWLSTWGLRAPLCHDP